MQRRGLTFLEVLLTMVLLSVALLALLSTTSSANRGSQDAYYEFMAFSLAKEPIEIFRGFGYHWLSEYEKHPLPPFPLDWAPISDSQLGMVLHPAEAASFRRTISLTKVGNDRTRGIRVRVTVAPVGLSRVMAWLSRDEVTMEALIPEKPL